MEERNPYGLGEKITQELRHFYSPYFENASDREAFISRVFQFDWYDFRPRRMMFQVQRFVTLAIEIDKIRPARDGLRVMFLKCGLESLMKLAGFKNAKKFYPTFEGCFSDEGQKYILNHFKLSHFEYTVDGIRQEESYELTFSDFFNIIKATRDMVVHDGNYWEMQFFAYDNDSTWLTDITTDEKMLSKYCYPKTKRTITYHFRTTLQYDRFIFYFVEACINFINNYINRKELELL